MISPIPEIEILWDCSEDVEFCSRFPRAAQAARGAVVALGTVAGMLLEAFENRSGDTDKNQDKILLGMILEELAEQVKAFGGTVDQD